MVLEGKDVITIAATKLQIIRLLDATFVHQVQHDSNHVPK